MDDIDWLRFPPLSALRALEAAYRLGGFSQAGRSLNVTHAAISQQVRGLEEHLGYALVRRDGRALAFTDEGRALAQAANAGFASIGRTLGDLSRSREGRALAVTMSPIFADKWLIPRLRQFWKLHPEITLSLRPTASVLDLARERIDLGIRYGLGDWPGTQATYLTSARFVVVAGPDFADSDAAPEVLARQPWIVEEDWAEPMNWLSSHGISIEGSPKMMFSTEELCLTAARQGLGLYVATAALVERDVQEGNLRIAFDPKDDNPAYYIVTPPGPLSNEARIFFNWLRTQT